jgi:hypothetical protein
MQRTNSYFRILRVQPERKTFNEQIQREENMFFCSAIVVYICITDSNKNKYQSQWHYQHTVL